MKDRLTYYRGAYDKLPDWVVKMDEYAPEALDVYTDFEQLIMKDGALSKKEKEWILIGINASRRYETSMIIHTKSAIDAGTCLEELAEILSVCILSRGLPAWLEGIKALKFALKYKKDSAEAIDDDLDSLNTHSINNKGFVDLDECLKYYQDTFGTKPQWVMDLANYNPESLLYYTNLRNKNLSDGSIPRKLKELILVGINTSERYPEGVRIHTEGAKSCGATDAELAECHLTAVLTAGIPAWIEGATLLK